MLILDITLEAQKVTLPVLALLSPTLRGLLAAGVCAVWALAIGVGIALWIGRRGGGAGEGG